MDKRISEQTTRIAQLRKFASPPIKLRGFALSPLLDPFVKCGALTMGVSPSEFVRRVLINDLLTWQRNGLYEIPAGFLASSAVEPCAPTPSGMSRVSPSRLEDMPRNEEDPTGYH